jgi:hypothetical protein
MARAAPSTCAHTATVARNRLKEASATASSKADRTMIAPYSLEQTENIVPLLFTVKPEAVAFARGGKSRLIET